MHATTDPTIELQETGISLHLEDGKIIAEPASELTDAQREQIRKNREEIVRQLRKDEMLDKALRHLSKKGVEYVPLDIEEDVNLEYEQDDLDAFRETLRGWVVELRSAA